MMIQEDIVLLMYFTSTLINQMLHAFPHMHTVFIFIIISIIIICSNTLQLPRQA